MYSKSSIDFSGNKVQYQVQLTRLNYEQAGKHAAQV